MKTTFSKKENLESGLALILLLLIVSLFLFHKSKIEIESLVVVVEITCALVLLAMVIPSLFYPFTLLWLNLSHFLGKISSTILLSLIFLFVVTLTGLIRKALNKDRLLLREFKKKRESVFKDRNIIFKKENLETPY